MEEINPTPLQAQRMAEALYSLSAVDGHVEREGMLIKAFWTEMVGSADAFDLRALESSKVDPAHLKDWVPAPLAMLFLETAVRLAYADGKVTPPERAWLSTGAKSLGISENELKRMDESVRGAMLRELSHVNNDALKTIAKELGF